MAVLFKFKADDPIIQGYLPSNVRNAITIWQSSDEYDFEFHSGHLTGNPIYIRPAGNRDTSNVPKFDTQNKSASDYTAISSFANGEKLTGLSTRAKNEILNIIQNNWAALSALARNYWVTGPVSEKSAEEIEMEAWIERETSDTGQHLETISRDDLNRIYGNY